MFKKIEKITKSSDKPGIKAVKSDKYEEESANKMTSIEIVKE